MKNTKMEGESAPENIEKTQLDKLVVLATVGLKLSRQIQEKLQSVEDSLEIIACEIGRQAERAE